jgi:5-oxoprolinase (ATP-hydrolysing) subunit C
MLVRFRHVCHARVSHAAANSRLHANKAGHSIKRRNPGLPSCRPKSEVTSMTSSHSRSGLHILAAGPGITLQDGGRKNFLRFGVTTAGPMDPLAFATANAAVEARQDSTAIEVSLGGLEVMTEGVAVTVAVAGGDFRLALGDRGWTGAARVRLDPHARLTISPGRKGVWCYLAIAGRVAVSTALGSTATHIRSALGGLKGTTLQAGDFLPISEPRVLDPPLAVFMAPWLERSGSVIRVVLGPQDDYFAADEIAAFLNGPWTISTRSDRMAYQLEGPRLKHTKGFNIVSDGVALGAIQVPGEGYPLVLMADRQPTGGYPKIATVIGADLGKLAQLRPGTQVRFQAVPLAEAVEARRAQARLLKGAIGLEPLIRTQFPSEFLLSLNLVDGVVGTTE